MKMFDGEDSDSDLELKTNTEYAKNYNTWRKKEEQHKLETKYGVDCLGEDDDSSSSSDSDSEGEVKFEKDFLKTLSFLKKKDPRIYDENYKFYESDEETEKAPKKKKKDAPVYMKDYERNLLLGQGGEISDDDDEDKKRYYESKMSSKTYVEEQEELKENLKTALHVVGDEEDEEIGGLFKARQSTAEEKKKEDEEYFQWLSGQTEHLKDQNAESELAPLKDYWNNPDLDKNEQLLRDYILEGKFTNKREDPNYIPTYDEIIHDSDNDLSEDEKTVERQENFEHKYNFRYEEPDQDFIKQYPRTISGSVRYTDDKRKIKRTERKERKVMEKKQKMEELNQLQVLKQMEIEEKIKQLQEVTGNENVCFKPEDLDGDFDPEKYDKTMQNLFNDEFYQGEEELQKPQFPDLDEELEIESWDHWKGQDDQGKEIDDVGTHCEDDNFNMDCDYDPANVKKELIDNSKKRKKRKRKSQFAEAVGKSKPVFDPKKKTFSEYLDEYYAFNCEDIIDNQPCRFQYRQVQPNSFGLSIEEILMAKEKELNKWCSLKKTVQYRPEHVEANEVKIYEQRGQRIDLKRKLLPSLFIEEQLQTAEVPSTTSVKTEDDISPETAIQVTQDFNSKKKTKMNLLIKEEHNDASDSKKSEKVGKKTKKNKIAQHSDVTWRTENIKLEPPDVSTTQELNSQTDENESCSVSLSPHKSKKNKKKRKQESMECSNDNHTTELSNQTKKRKKSQFKNDNHPAKKRKTEFNKSTDIGISDARLMAYGINPKKFKNKIKYNSKANN